MLCSLPSLDPIMWDSLKLSIYTLESHVVVKNRFCVKQSFLTNNNSPKLWW